MDYLDLTVHLFIYFSIKKEEAHFQFLNVELTQHKIFPYTKLRNKVTHQKKKEGTIDYALTFDQLVINNLLPISNVSTILSS